MCMKFRTILFTCFQFTILFLNAQIKPAGILTDNMVLQRNTEVKLWGTANPREKLVVTTGWNKVKHTVTVNEKGEWLVKVATADAGGPYTISFVSKTEQLELHNILLGEVWICSGQSNMDMPIRGYLDQPINNANDLLVDADNDDIRLFTVNNAMRSHPIDSCVGKYGIWKPATAESVASFSAVAYLYAKQLQQKLKVPVGVITTAWGGSRIEWWMDSASIVQFPEAYRQTTDPKLSPQMKASYLYNGMIHPLLNVAIKGVIWFQGEANVNNNGEYAALMAGMVSSWRKNFAQGDFPFYYVQITPYFYNNSKATNAALLREAQVKAQSVIPNSGMACTLDLGEEKIIHAAEKLTIAKRLSYWAFAKTYGIAGIACQSPTYKAIHIKDSVAIIDFDYALNGLSSFGKPVDCFEIAGADKVFYPATWSTNRKNQVLVTAPQVKEPVAVRYGFHNFPLTAGYLYNTAGLPVPSFRTDDWQ